MIFITYMLSVYMHKMSDKHMIYKNYYKLKLQQKRSFEYLILNFYTFNEQNRLKGLIYRR